MTHPEFEFEGGYGEPFVFGEHFIEINPQMLMGNSQLAGEAIFRAFQEALAYQRAEADVEMSNIFEANKALGEYCIEAAIEDVVFVDRSARPIWNTLSEYYNLAHPEAVKPRMHFLSPEMIDLTSRADHVGLSEKTFRSLSESLNRSTARKELKSTQNSLLENPDARILVIDACTHSGGTLTGVKKLLQSIGYRDIQLGVFTDGSQGYPLPFKLDFSYTDDQDKLGCRPYGEDDGLRKAKSVYTHAAHHPTYDDRRNFTRAQDRELIRVYYADSLETGDEQ